MKKKILQSNKTGRATSWTSGSPAVAGGADCSTAKQWRWTTAWCARRSPQVQTCSVAVCGETDTSEAAEVAALLPTVLCPIGH